VNYIGAFYINGGTAMKIGKKKLSMLCLTLVLCIVVSCAAPVVEEPKPEPTQRPVTENTLEAQPKIDEIEVPEEVAVNITPLDDPKIYETIKDMDGQIFKFGTFWPEFYDPNRGTNAAYRAAALESIERDYNCIIDIVPLNQFTYAQDINTAKAAGRIMAEIFETQNAFNDLIYTGILADLRTVSTVDLVNNEWNKGVILSSTYREGIYGVGIEQSVISRACIYFNKDIAARYNLGNFYEMVMNREWTFDRFLEISKEVFERSNGTIFGMNGYGQECFTYFTYANDVSPVKIVNGKAVFDYQNDALLSALNYVQNYAKYGLIDQELFARNMTHADSWEQQLSFSDGESLFLLGFNSTHIWLDAMMDDDYGLLPFPMGPDVNDYKAISNQSGFFSLFDENPNIEDAGTIMTAIASRTYFRIADYDRALASTMRDRESIDMLHLLMNSEFIFKIGKDVTEYDRTAIRAIVDMSKTPKEALEAVAQAAQVQVDRYYGN